MINKLEVAYLSILRIAVVVIASVFLLAALGLTISAIHFEPSKKDINPSVSEKEFIKFFAEKNAPKEVRQAESTPSKIEDPNAALYAKAAHAIAIYFDKQTSGQISIDEDKLAYALKNEAKRFDDPKVVASFANGLVDSFVPALEDQSIVSAVKKGDALGVFSSSLALFVNKFDESVKKEKMNLLMAQKNYMNDKSEGMKNLYIAAGFFSAFIMIIFLSVILKIERNLRHLEPKTTL